MFKKCLFIPYAFEKYTVRSFSKANASVIFFYSKHDVRAES